MIIENLSKELGRRSVLRQISLSLEPGKTCVLIGPSGCGKTTLLKVMVGLIRPDSGTVTVDAEPLRGENLRAMRRRFGYVIQEGGLFPHLTAMDNLRLMPDYLKWSDQQFRHRLASLIELTQFPADALERYPAQLSGGQCQRVSLMRALFLDPDYLFLDEPLGALDPLIRSDLQTELNRVFLRLNKTVVFVTHDLNEAMYFADQIVLMNDGAIEQRGSAEDFIQRPASAFVTRFVQAQRYELTS